MGQPVETVLGLATELRAGVIVIGDPGQSSLLRALFGTVASRIVHHASCSVLVARPKQG